MQGANRQIDTIYSDYGYQAHTDKYIYVFVGIYFKFDSRAPSTFAIFLSIYCAPSRGTPSVLPVIPEWTFTSGHCPLSRFQAYIACWFGGKLWKSIQKTRSVGPWRRLSQRKRCGRGLLCGMQNSATNSSAYPSPLRSFRRVLIG